MNVKTVVITLGVLMGSALTAYAQDRTAIVSDAAPIYVVPDANRTPLRTAAANTVLHVRGEEGDWLKVEFQDPQFGLRTGYVETRLVRVNNPALQPMDLSVRDSGPQVVSQSAQPQVFAPVPDVNRAGKHVKEGFWFNAGMGFGSLGCDDCFDRANGLSGGLSFGRTVSDRLLLGVGTAGWARSDSDLQIGLLDVRMRFYPSAKNGFFLTTGVGFGSVSGIGSTELGLGVLLGLGADIRVGRNVSLTPFWNGFAMRSSLVDANVGQIGLGVTIH